VNQPLSLVFLGVFLCWVRYGDIESTFTKRLGVGCDNFNRIGRFIVLHEVFVHGDIGIDTLSWKINSLWYGWPEL